MAAMQAMERAVNDGRITQERLAQSLARVATLKAQYLHPYKPVTISDARLVVGCYEQLSGIIDGKSHHINYQHLVMLLSGISLVGLHQRPRYEMKKTG